MSGEYENTFPWIGSNLLNWKLSGRHWKYARTTLALEILLCNQGSFIHTERTFFGHSHRTSKYMLTLCMYFRVLYVNVCNCVWNTVLSFSHHAGRQFFSSVSKMSPHIKLDFNLSLHFCITWVADYCCEMLFYCKQSSHKTSPTSPQNCK